MAGRVREKDLLIPARRLAASRPNGFISTSDLIAELSEIFNPTGTDAQILEGRNDTHFSQKVRNLISHRDSGTSIIKKGYAEYVNVPSPADRGTRVTDKGRQLLAELGEDDA
jgi:hypothetical protein